MEIEVMGNNGNGYAVLECEWVGMGMGMIRWEWEGNGNKKVISPHTSSRGRHKPEGAHPEYTPLRHSTNILF